MQQSTITVESIPQELRDRRAWVLWRSEVDGKRVPLDTDKARKVPYQISGKRASSTDDKTWATFDAVVKRFNRGGYDGIGCVITPPYVGIDLDECIDSNGLIHQWAVDILNKLPSYAEISPSGKGIKIWVKGEIPASIKTESIEMYSRGRYFTVTGNTQTPKPIRAVNGELTELWASLQKPTEIPLEAHRKPVQPPIVSDYMQIWIDSVIERGRLIVASAADGNKHNARIRAAKLLGGLVAYGVSEDEIINLLYDAQPPSANLSGELKAIRDGIEYGKRNPLTAPKQPPQPEMINSVAYCPVHHTVVPRAKNGNGYKCHAKDESTASGWCDFWWKGDGYMVDSQPILKTSQQYIELKPEDVITRFVPQSRGDLDKVAPPQWLLRGELVRGYNFLYGPSGSGKTFYAIDLAARVCATIGAVVYIPTEDTGGLRIRVTAWELAHGRKLDNFYWINAVKQQIDLTNPKDVDDLIAGLLIYKPKLTVIDTLAMAHTGDEVNSVYSTVNRAIQRIMIETGTYILLVHHTGVNEGRERGGTALMGNVDIKLKVSSEDGLIRIQNEKIRNGIEPDACYFRLTSVDTGILDDDSQPILSAVIRPAAQVTQRGAKLTPQQKTVLNALALETFKIAGAKVAQLSQVLQGEVSQAGIYRTLSKLLERNLVSQSTKGDPFYITDKGRDAIAPEYTEMPESEYTPLDGYSDSQDSNADSQGFSPDSQGFSSNDDSQFSRFSLSLDSENLRKHEKSENPENPQDELFADDTPQPQLTIDPEYIRKAFDRGDMGAIAVHCGNRRRKVNDVLAELGLLTPEETDPDDN